MRPPKLPLAPWGRVLAVDPSNPDTPASLRQLRRSAVRILRTTMGQARTAIEAAAYLGMDYRSLLRLADAYPDELYAAYERAVVQERRANGAH